MVQTPMTRERLSALREEIARLENENVPGLLKAARKGAPAGFEQKIGNEDAGVSRQVLPLGIAALDDILQGGLPLGGLTEIRTAETRDAGAAMGFVLALAVLCQDRGQAVSPVLWIGQGMTASEAGPPYGRGLQAYGLDTGRCIFSSPRTVADALWIAEAALSVPVFTAIILEIRGNPAQFGLNESRRLHMRARTGKVPIFLLRQAGEEEASSAIFRFRVAPAPAAGRPLPDGSMLAGSIGNPVFRVAVEKSRAFAPLELLMEWSSHARRFRDLVPETAASAAKRQPAHSVAELPASAGGPGGADEMGRVMAFQKAS
ncbi:ImuA family protein [Pararhizobium sp. DWP3-4]|uniref:ImuA family protein n=1 Tax=Pararhizobium sp. DWP3-4 TaxID=2804565 RepID=UPI003CF961FE